MSPLTDLCLVVSYGNVSDDIRSSTTTRWRRLRLGWE